MRLVSIIFVSLIANIIAEEATCGISPSLEKFAVYNPNRVCVFRSPMKPKLLSTFRLSVAKMLQKGIGLGLFGLIQGVFVQQHC